MRILLLRVLLVVGVVLAATGCSTASSSSTPGWIGASDYEKERAAEAARLQWPNGAPASFGPAQQEYQGVRMSYQSGAGATDADQAWFCAWSKEWLDGRTADANNANTALTQLEGITKLAIWPNLMGGQQGMSDALDKAKLGDPSGILQTRQYFCM